ncbi:flagellar basal body P-ring formation chaperone FlgA [Caballeronia sp. dw_276]|jgi:flagella basal body P-ring formation protein FlgA|uniref:flagellar basal body P-ring formation chaperone FlgA n=1 Tax=Caballeronia sp. dw_276 TaxID=2719795 RepID=UPI001BD2C38E|nr:flagellar basal body P-ring formation chaperone FlgA [Caballeronia sp. dw_276]
MHSFAAPDRRTATRRQGTVGSTSTIAWRLNALAFGCALALAVAAMPALAQENGGAIMISGPGETNPAAVVAMARNAGMTVNGATPAAQPQPNVQSMGGPSPRGYARAVNGANAAMRAAALALEARADAADASSSSADNSGMIVIPGNGEAKPAQPKLAMAPSQSQSAAQSAPASGMIEIPGNGEPSAHAAISNSATAARPVQRVGASARDVTPVVVEATDAVVPNRIATRGFQARPIAAAPAMPVTGGMMAVSMRPAAPVQAAPLQAAAIRAPLAPAAATPRNGQPSQDGDSIRAAALAFLQQQAAGLPGKADITVTPVFPRGLAPCATLEPFMPPGARIWGRTTVGVRCTGDRPWTLYLQARVSLQATYYLAARAMAPGEVLTAADLTARDGDITSMPQAIVTDPSQAVGATTLSRIVAGLPLRTDMLRGASSVVIGSSVHVVTSGAGFSISAEGSAMNNATPGQQVRVKTAGGQIITGIVKDSSTVEVQL